MKHERFEIWEEPNPNRKSLPWRAQLINYVGEFMTRAHAERFVAGIKLFREKAGLK